jgi:GT2 family glycosyltransferase
MSTTSSPPHRGQSPREQLELGPAARQRRVCICILNWNGWRDTVECLESVFRTDHPAYQVVVVDNGSEDGSLSRFRSWAEGASAFETQTPPELRHLVAPPVRKPIRYREFDRYRFESITSGNAPGDPMLLVRNETNLGFAGGINVGLRYVLRVGGFDYVWLLNNDTVVRPDALEHLVRRMEAEPRVGLCGSTLLFYDAPELVQALGGFRYNVWFGLARQIGQRARYAELSASELGQVERAMFGVQGASVLVSRRFLQDVGVLSEDHFLYFEEQDWAVRARRSGYVLGYSPASVVYHKEGRSTRNNSLSPATRSPQADYYQIQARLLFTRRFFPYALPTIYVGLLGVLLNRLRRRQYRRAHIIAGLALRSLVSPLPRRALAADLGDASRAKNS